MKVQTHSGMLLFVGALMFSVLACMPPDRRQDEIFQGIFGASDTNVVVSLNERPFWQVTSKKTGATIDPGIDIYADGRCSIRRWDGTEIEHMVSKETIGELLRNLHQSEFFEMTTAELDEAISREQSREGTMRFITDQAVTRIVARTPTRTNSVEQYAIDWKLRTYPKVEELGAFFECMRHIHKAAEETETHLWRRREQEVGRVAEGKR
jgi:hypothetical protein